ncbi:MAG: DUF1513 domain-containing protein [Pseudomonadota bacterium]
MNLKRREFLQWLAIGASTAAGAACSKAPAPTVRSGLIVGGGKFIDPEAPGKGAQYTLAVVDTRHPTPQLIDIPFLPHGIAFSETDPNRLRVFEKIGPGACEVDLATSTMTRVIANHPERFFYGHGALSKDQSLLFATETYLDSQRGVVAVRDADTLQLLGEFPTYGDNPHDCRLIEEGTVLLITNGGGSLGSQRQPSVTYVDVASKRLIERLYLDNRELNAGHIARAQDGAIAVVSAPRKGMSEEHLGGVSLRRGKATALVNFREPIEVVQRMRGEALSVAIHEARGVVAVTHPNGNMVSFWSILSNAFIKMLEFERPRGVTLSADSERFILSYGRDASLIEIDADTLDPLPDTRKVATYITGSHIYNWDIEIPA